MINVRPQLAQDNPYWISRHRYYELKHFCLQYYFWKSKYNEIDISLRSVATDSSAVRNRSHHRTLYFHRCDRGRIVRNN